MAQLDLFATCETALPAFDPELRNLRRVELDHGAWLDVVPGWVTGHLGLFDALWRGTRWRHERRPMYDRVVDVPRLVASLPADGEGHPILDDLRAALGARYRENFQRVGLALYRDGQDRVAHPGDTTARDMREAVVATVSLGAPRRFHLRPTDGGRSHVLALGGGDLFVMGGTCQRTWRHAIPKVAAAVGPRIAVMFRPQWEAD